MYFITHRHKQQCSVGQREGGWGWVEAGREGNNGDTCNSVNNEKIEYRSLTFKALRTKRLGPQVAPRLTSWVPTLSFLSYFFNTHMRTHSLIIFIERERAGERE